MAALAESDVLHPIPVLALEEIAWRAQQLGAQLRAWRYYSGTLAEVFFRGKLVVDVRFGHLRGLVALAAIFAHGGRGFYLEHRALAPDPDASVAWSLARMAAMRDTAS